MKNSVATSSTTLPPNLSKNGKKPNNATNSTNNQQNSSVSLQINKFNNSRGPKPISLIPLGNDNYVVMKNDNHVNYSDQPNSSGQFGQTSATAAQYNQQSTQQSTTAFLNNLYTMQRKATMDSTSVMFPNPATSPTKILPSGMGNRQFIEFSAAQDEDEDRDSKIQNPNSEEAQWQAVIQPDDLQILSSVAEFVNELVYFVAVKHSCEKNKYLIEEMEDFQKECWEIERQSNLKKFEYLAIKDKQREKEELLKFEKEKEKEERKKTKANSNSNSSTNNNYNLINSNIINNNNNKTKKTAGKQVGFFQTHSVKPQSNYNSYNGGNAVSPRAKGEFESPMSPQNGAPISHSWNQQRSQLTSANGFSNQNTTGNFNINNNNNNTNNNQNGNGISQPLSSHSYSPTFWLTLDSKFKFPLHWDPVFLWKFKPAGSFSFPLPTGGTVEQPQNSRASVRHSHQSSASNSETANGNDGNEEDGPASSSSFVWSSRGYSDPLIQKIQEIQQMQLETIKLEKKNNKK